MFENFGFAAPKKRRLTPAQRAEEASKMQKARLLLEAKRQKHEQSMEERRLALEERRLKLAEESQKAEEARRQREDEQRQQQTAALLALFSKVTDKFQL